MIAIGKIEWRDFHEIVKIRNSILVSGRNLFGFVIKW